MENVTIVTKHAYKRAKKRLRWKKETIDKMSDRAFIDGVTHKGTKGRLNKFITSVWYRNKAANNIRIYGENIYFFADNRLMTIYRIDNNLIKYLKIK